MLVAGVLSECLNANPASAAASPAARVGLIGVLVRPVVVRRARGRARRVRLRDVAAVAGAADADGVVLVLRALLLRHGERTCDLLVPARLSRRLDRRVG